MKKTLLFLLTLFPTIAFADTNTLRCTTAVKASDGTVVSVTAGAYTAKDSVGGLLKFPGALCPDTNKGSLHTVYIGDKNDQSAGYILTLYPQSPAGTFTNDAATDPADADLALTMAAVSIVTGDHISYNDNGESLVQDLDNPLWSNDADSNQDSGDIWGNLMTTSTPTYGSTSDVSIRVCVRCSFK